MVFGRLAKSPSDVDSEPPGTSKSATQAAKTGNKDPKPPEIVKESKLAKHAKSLKQWHSGNITPEPEDPLHPVNNAGLYKATFYSNIGSFFFGIAMGWTSGAEDSVMYHKSYGYTPSNLQWSYVCILLTLGATVWCLPTGLLLRWCGCKRTILAQLLPNAVGWCLTVWGHNISMLYAGRFILGMCGGALSVAVPIYSAEISSVRKRGIMGSCFYGACIVGVCYSLLMSSFLEIRIVNVANLILLLLLLLQFLMPESPSYYVNRGKLDLAENSLRWLRGKNHNVSKEMATLTRVPSSSEHAQHQNPQAGFQYTGVRRSLARALVLAVLHKLCGAHIFILYSNKLVACLKLPYKAVAALGVSALVGVLVCLILVERVGRKALLIFSSAFMFFASVIIGIGLKLFLENGGDVVPWVTFCCMPVFVGAYMAGLGTLTWLLTVELFMPPMRPMGCSIAATVSWLCASLAIVWYSSFDIICQPYLFLLFAIVAVMNLLFTLAFIPETKGLTPRQIQKKMFKQRTMLTPHTSSDDSDAELRL